VAAWRAKRAYQTPRPISMVRYLAFQGQSSDPSLPSYSPEGLPLVPGLIELVTSDSSAPGQRHAELAGHVGQVAVRSRGRWILGARWRPASSTPASPGWVSGAGAFAAAADEVLTTLSGRSFDRRAAAAAGRGVAAGVDTRADVAAGRALGTRVARAALARVRRLAAGAP
jgi:hypothetical protein